MNAKKQREKNRRRASKLAEQAWEASDDDHFDLAAKIIRRAVELNPANPVLWHDQGTLLLQLNEEDQAAASFQAAISAAPDFAEAYASLAAIRARQGKVEQAVTLQREAVRHAPTSERLRNALAAYEALLAGEFLFCDQPERKPSDRCLIPAGLGDAVIFCTRARLVRVGDVYGLKPVKHGLDRVTAGTRYAIGIPFHEFE